MKNAKISETLTKQSPNKKLTRNYSDKTKKVLFAFSGNNCAEPSCDQPVIKSATSSSDALVVAQIAHIYALNIDGPRGKAGITEAELNGASNLILLCPTHHIVVDGQHETYPASLLIEWKTNHERKSASKLAISIGEIGFAELEVAARALSGTKTDATNGFQILPAAAKIKKNALGSSSEMLLSMGAAKSNEVATVLLQATQLDPDFPNRLKAGFTSKYIIAQAAGFSGDALFAEMYDWAAGGSNELPRTASGLCILTHLFILCDIFEK